MKGRRIIRSGRADSYSRPGFLEAARVVNSEFVEWAKSHTGHKFHACLCDPSYGYHFMGAKWDDPRQMTRNQAHSYLPPGHRMTTVEKNIAFQNAAWQWGEAMLPRLFPGAIILMFGGTRMFEWLSTGMQMAGFEHWDTFCWLQGEGFPKAQDISKLIDKANGDQRGEVVSISSGPNHRRYQGERYGETRQTTFGTVQDQPLRIAPGSPASYPWSGHKTPALKPAWEPILCFRAPRNGMTHAELALQFGTGCLNIEGGRIGIDMISTHNAPAGAFAGGEPGRGSDTNSSKERNGRYPTNVILDEEAATLLGERSRFFYCAKASSWERDAGCEGLPLIKSGMSGGAQTHGEGYDRGQGVGLNRVIGRYNDHPCVKPLALTRHLATLLLPPTSVGSRRILVPFCGSGSEMIGAYQAGWDEIVGIEQDAHYCEIAKRRLDYWRKAS